MACPDCFKGAIHDHAEPKGHFETIYGVNTYVAGEPGSTTSKSAILYLPDVYSLKLVNNKILADRYAAGTGCKVLFPDLVYDGGADPALMPKIEFFSNPLKPWTLSGFLAKIWTLVTTLPSVLPHIIWGQPAKAVPAVLKYARAMKQDLAPGGKLGVVGFCWGGHCSTAISAEPSVEGGHEALIDAQFNGHTSLTTNDMIVAAVSKFKVPYAAAVAADDYMFNEAKALDAQAALRKEVGPPEENNYEFRIYKDCKHGFCVRARPGPNFDGYHAAAKWAVEWFNKWLN